MFAKILLVIIAFCLIGAQLLVIRHERLQMAHDMADLHRQIRRDSQTLWQLRAEIAHRIRPEDVERLMADLPLDWQPLPTPPSPPPSTPLNTTTSPTVPQIP